MNIIKELEKQGLTNKKAIIYKAILELGRASSMDIAQKTKIKRTTVYDVVLDLIQLGYVTETRKGKRRLFIAEDPMIIFEKYEEKKEAFKVLLPFLSEIRNNVVPKPTVRFYDGTEGVRKIMEEFLLVENKVQFFWSSMSDLIDVFGNRYMERWVRRRIRRGILSKVLLTKKSKLPKLYEQTGDNVLREIKWLPKNYSFDGVLCVFDNKVGYISSRQEHFGFVVESKEFAQIMKLIFNSSWDMIP